MPGRLKQIVDEYSVLAKRFNLTTLAVSALIKKIMIANIPSGDFGQEIVSFVKTELEIRYQKLFCELVELHKQICEPGFTYSLEMAIVRLHEKIEKMDPVGESILGIYEAGVEVQSEISRISQVNVVQLVSLVRSSSSSEVNKVTEVSEMLEARLEKKLHLSVLE